MDVESKEILEEAFGKPEEAIEEVESEEEIEDEVEDETEEEVVDEEESEEEIEDESSDELETLNEKASGLETALRIEREKRKAATQTLSELQQSIQTEKSRAEMTSSQIEKVRELLDKSKEDGFVDADELEKVLGSQPDVDPRIEQLLAAQQQQVFVTSMQQEVANQVDAYKNIDTTSDKQGNILARMVLSNVSMGQQLTDATENALTELNDFLDSTIAKAKKTRSAPVKPKRKIKTAVKAKAQDSKMTALKKAKAGNSDDYFNKVADKLFG